MFIYKEYQMKTEKKLQKYQVPVGRYDLTEEQVQTKAHVAEKLPAWVQDHYGFKEDTLAQMREEILPPDIMQPLYLVYISAVPPAHESHPTYNYGVFLSLAMTVVKLEAYKKYNCCSPLEKELKDSVIYQDYEKITYQLEDYMYATIYVVMTNETCG